MMKFTILALLAVTYVLADDDITKCKCNEGYEARKDPDGKVKCYGILLKAIMPCNLVSHPKCKCSEPVTSVLTDANGTWCTQFTKGKEIKRWECENKEEWEEFFKNHSEFKKTSDSTTSTACSRPLRNIKDLNSS